MEKEFVEPAANAALKEVAHTPGPWMLEGNWTLASPRLGGWISTTHPAPLFQLIPITGEKAEIIANAHVLAAAPEMLAALQMIDADWTKDWPAGPDTELREGCRFADDTLAFWRAARAAILKATSGSSAAGAAPTPLSE